MWINFKNTVHVLIVQTTCKLEIRDSVYISSSPGLSLSLSPPSPLLCVVMYVLS